MLNKDKEKDLDRQTNTFLQQSGKFTELGKRNQKAVREPDTQEVLVRSETELRTTLYSIGDAVIATDIAGRITRMNPMAEQLTGWNETEAIGQPLDRVFHVINEKTRRPMGSLVTRVLDEGKVIGLANHTLLISKEGKEIPIADSAAPIFDPHGNISGVVLVTRDQTKERLTQRYLDTRLSLIEYAIHHPLDELLTYALDKVGSFVDSPIGFYHFVEPDQKTLSLQQWSTRTLEEFCQAQGKGKHYSIDKAGVWVDCVYEKKPVIHNDYASLKHKKGFPPGHAEVIRQLVVPVIREDKVVAILGVGNKPAKYTQQDVEIVSYLADVTWEIVNHKRTEEELRHERDKANTYLDIAEVMFVALNAQGEITLINQKGSQILGYEQEEILGENWFDKFLPENVREDIRSAFNQIISGQIETLEDYENPIITRSGEVRIIAWHNALLTDETGCVIGTLSSGEDITKRRLAEETLRESERRYQLIFENSGTANAIFDTEFRLILQNSLSSQHLGADPKEVLGKSVLDIFGPVRGSTILERMQRVLNSGIPETFETKFSLPDGEKWFRTAYQPIFDPQHRVFGVQTISQDISQQKQAELALLESERNLREAQNIANMGYYAFDTATGLWTNSAKLDQIFGMDADYCKDITGWLQIVHPDDREMMQHYLQDNVLGQHQPFNKEYKIINLKTGQERWVHGLGNLKLDEDNNPVTMFGTIQDITERKNVEKALREAILGQQEAVRAANVGLWDWNLITNKVRYSDEWKSQIGYAPHEISDDLEEWRSRVHPDDLEITLKHIEICIAEIRQEYQVEFRFRHKDGAYRWILAQGSVFQDETGRPIRMRGSHIDITERKQAEVEKARLEKQFHQTQKLESIGRLAGGVAHDFNNLLTVILGHTEMSMAEVTPDQPLYANLEEIRKAAERSANLTRQLLAFARKQIIAPKVLDLNDTVESMLKMLRRLIGEDIDLIWIPKTGLWSIKMDPSQIDQILVNLCVNARDAIADVGKITIETNKAVFDQEYCDTHEGFIPGEFVLLVVSDNGEGMDKKTAENIFEPFFTTKTADQGTGLGLSTIYGIVKQNNGFINVYSEPNHGTTFKLYFPRHLTEAKQTQKESLAVSIPRGYETLLLVEDEASILAIGRQILESFGYKVLVAKTPDEAIQIANEYPDKIDLLITDVIMPKMNGRDLSKSLATLYPHLKCLFMSGYTANVIAHHGVLDEGINFIQKPFSRDDLVTKVRQILDD